MTEIQKLLFDRQDLTYRDFQSRLMPTVDPETVIGVRMPALRKLAKELAGTQPAEDFLRQLPHRLTNALQGPAVAGSVQHGNAVFRKEACQPLNGFAAAAVLPQGADAQVDGVRAQGEDAVRLLLQAPQTALAAERSLSRSAAKAAFDGIVAASR